MSPNSETDDVPRDPFGPAERISRAAAREAARGRRVLWLYVALSLVPVLAAVMFLRYGRTDRQLVESEVQAQVAPVKSEVEQVRPALQEVKQIGTLATEVRNLGAVASEVRGAAAKVDAYGEQLQQLKSKTDTVTSTMEERGRQVATLHAEAAALRSELQNFRTEQVNFQQRYEGNQSQIKEEIRGLRTEIQRRPAVSDPAVRELIQRINVLEGRVAPLERRVRIPPPG